jgi:hypothetical protein
MEAGRHTEYCHLLRIASAPIAFFLTQSTVKDACGEIQELFICLLVGWFSWRYNPLWLYFHCPVVGFSLQVLRDF